MTSGGGSLLPPRPHRLRVFGAQTDERLRPGLFVCGEYQSLSSIHWALVSGRRAGEAVLRELRS
ncbi:MAG: hypothetical protein WHT07_12675 [Desulfobaccales bacterium]